MTGEAPKPNRRDAIKLGISTLAVAAAGGLGYRVGTIDGFKKGEANGVTWEKLTTKDIQLQGMSDSVTHDHVRFSSEKAKTIFDRLARVQVRDGRTRKTDVPYIEIGRDQEGKPVSFTWGGDYPRKVPGTFGVHLVENIPDCVAVDLPNTTDPKEGDRIVFAIQQDADGKSKVRHRDFFNVVFDDRYTIRG